MNRYLFPIKIIRTYFEQFVVDVFRKSRGGGRRIYDSQTFIHHWKSLFVYDFIENKWMMDTRYEYHMFQFSGNDRSVRKTKITFDDRS